MEPTLAILTTLVVGAAVAFCVMVVLAVRRRDWDELSILLVGLAAAALAGLLDTLLGTIHSPWHIGFALACVILGVALIEWRAWRRGTLTTAEKLGMMALWVIASAIFYVGDFWIVAALTVAALLYVSLRPQTVPSSGPLEASGTSAASSAGPESTSRPTKEARGIVRARRQ